MKTFKQVHEEKTIAKKLSHEKCIRDIETFNRSLDTEKLPICIENFDTFTRSVIRNLQAINFRWIQSSEYTGVSYEDMARTVSTRYKKVFYEVWLMIRLRLPDNFEFIPDCNVIIEQDIDKILQGELL